MPKRKIIGVAFVLLFLVGCAAKTEPDFSGVIPDPDDKLPEGMISIAALKAIYGSKPVTIDTEISIRGRIVSSDRWGNFYRTLCIEDNSGGITLRIDMEHYFTLFPYGDQVTVYCNSLTLGMYGGLVQLGTLDADATGVGYIPEDMLMSFIHPADEVVEPTRTEVTIEAISPLHVGRLVTLSGVQFTQESDTKWCDPKETHTSRYLTDKGGNLLAVRNSSYVTFADDPLPSGSGTISGVLGYFNGNYQLTIVHPRYAVMNGERFRVEE